jgi:hypothetical protein
MHWMRFWILYFSLTEAPIDASRNVEIRIPMTGLLCIGPDICFESDRSSLTILLGVYAGNLEFLPPIRRKGRIKPGSFTTILNCCSRQI